MVVLPCCHQLDLEDRNTPNARGTAHIFNDITSCNIKSWSHQTPASKNIPSMRVFKRKRNASAGQLKIEPCDVYTQEVERAASLGPVALTTIFWAQPARTVLDRLGQQDLPGNKSRKTYLLFHQGQTGKQGYLGFSQRVDQLVGWVIRRKN